jgi:chromosome segregation ATPase
MTRNRMHKTKKLEKENAKLRAEVESLKVKLSRANTNAHAESLVFSSESSFRSSSSDSGEHENRSEIYQSDMVDFNSKNQMERGNREAIEELKTIAKKNILELVEKKSEIRRLQSEIGSFKTQLAKINGDCLVLEEELQEKGVENKILVKRVKDRNDTILNTTGKESQSLKKIEELQRLNGQLLEENVNLKSDNQSLRTRSAQLEKNHAENIRQQVERNGNLRQELRESQSELNGTEAGLRYYKREANRNVVELGR